MRYSIWDDPAFDPPQYQPYANGFAASKDAIFRDAILRLCGLPPEDLLIPPHVNQSGRLYRELWQRGWNDAISA